MSDNSSFKKYHIGWPNPWQFPSRTAYVNLEGPGVPVSKNMRRKIRSARLAWQLPEIAWRFAKLMNDSTGKTLLLQIEDYNSYYDQPEEVSLPFLAELANVSYEQITDIDAEFEQLFLFLSAPRLENGTSIFLVNHRDYNNLIVPDAGGLYKMPFRCVRELAISQ